MNSKFKKICVAITTLILSLSMSLESFADTHYNGDQGGGGSNQNMKIMPPVVHLFGSIIQIKAYDCMLRITKEH